MNILSIHPMGARIELTRAELEALQAICKTASGTLLDTGDRRGQVAAALAGAFQACALGSEVEEERRVYARVYAREHPPARPTPRVITYMDTEEARR